MQVEIEAGVLVKIIRHCRANYPNAVNGLLIGLERQDVLEITDAVELLSKNELTGGQHHQQQTLASNKAFEERMSVMEATFHARALEALQTANGDCNNPGWYQTMLTKDLHDTDVIAGLLDYHEHGNLAVVIGFDPSSSSSGASAFKAFRLSTEALTILQTRRQEMGVEGDSSNHGFKELAGRPLLEEVPLVIRSSLLAQAFLMDWLSSNKQSVVQSEFEVLDRDAQTSALSENIGFIQRCLEDLSSEEEVLMRVLKENARLLQKHREAVERRRIENEQRRLRNDPPLPDLPAFQPAPLPSLLPILFNANNARRTTKSVANIVSEDIRRSYLLPRLGVDEAY